MCAAGLFEGTNQTFLHTTIKTKHVIDSPLYGESSCTSGAANIKRASLIQPFACHRSSSTEKLASTRCLPIADSLPLRNMAIGLQRSVIYLWVFSRIQRGNAQNVSDCLFKDKPYLDFRDSPPHRLSSAPAGRYYLRKWWTL